MAKYKVINNFYDENDKNKDGKKKHYKEGDSYPKPANKKVTKVRIAELSTAKNKLGIPFIKEVEEEKKKESETDKEK